MRQTKHLLLLLVAFCIGCGSNGDVDKLRERVAELEEELAESKQGPETVVDVKKLRGFLESQLSEPDSWITSSSATETLTKKLSAAPDDWPSFAIGEYLPITEGSSTNQAQGQCIQITDDGTLIYRRCEVTEPGGSDGVYNTWGKLSYDEYIVNIRTLEGIQDPGDTQLRLNARDDSVRHVRAGIAIPRSERDGDFVVTEDADDTFVVLIPDNTSASLVVKAFEDLIEHYSNPEWYIPTGPANDDAK